MERYELLGPVGEGSYGTVLKCRQRDSGRLVAIKKFMDSDDDKTVKKIALREIKLLRQLRHDNLVNLLEVWKRRRRWYLVFEFVDRTLLDDLEQNPNGLDLNTSRQYLYQILRAATFCHQQNIIHRDIKPENILISQGGVVKLCDFGFARTVASSGEGSVYTDYVATRWYRAPELLVGDIKYGKPVDVWAIGCLLLEMLTGQALFPGDSDLDQIYHILRCFGNLTSHHQELFYRNPVFSGVRLPECSSRVPLQQRFPTMTPTALGLAQSCLEMDPERRAQCSDLLDHPWFTQDSFHIRFLDELNAKIQNDHRENSTFPKITKTPRPERDDGEEKNRKGKDKKQPDSIDEKKDKTKGKQPLKLSKTTRNTSESTKQPKTISNKAIHNAVQSSIKNKGGKVSGSEVKPDSSETTKTAGSMKDINRGPTKPPEPKEDYTKSSDKTEQNVTDKNKIKSKLSQEGGKTSKVPKLSKSSTSDRPDENQSGVELTDTGLAPKSEPSSGEHRTPTTVSNTETCTTRTPSEDHPGVCTEDRTSECSNQKQSTSNSTPKMNKTTSPSKTLTLGLSGQSSKGLLEPSPMHSTVGLAKGTSNSKLSRTSKGLPKEIDVTEEDCGSLKTEIPENLVGTSHTSDYEENPESSDPSSQHQHSTSESKISTEPRMTSTSMLNQNTSTGATKTLTVSDKENREDLALSVSMTTRTKSLLHLSESKEIRSNFKSDVKSFNVSHNKSLAGKPKTKPGSFSNHRRSTEASTPDLKASTAGLYESVFRGPHSSPPPPPPPPSSTPLLLPPSSTSLTPSFCVVNTSSPSVSDHFTLGTGFPSSVRSLDKPRHHGGISGRQAQHVPGSLTFQASEKSLLSERSFLSDRCNLGNSSSGMLAKNKPHVYFPDLRVSMLPELRGREGKHNKTKDQRKHPSSPPSEHSDTKQT